MFNVSDSKWYYKTKQPDHSKSDQIAAILDSYVLVLFTNDRTILIAVSMVLTILIPKFELQKILDFKWVLYLNVQYSSPHYTVIFLFECGPPIFYYL